MRNRLLHAALACVALISLARAQAPADVAAKIIDEGKNRSQVMRHLHYLTNGIGHRLTSSDNLTAACVWAKASFDAMGLQKARLEEWGSFPVGFNRRTMTGRMIAPTQKALGITTPSWGAGTPGLVRGRAVLAPEGGDVTEEVVHGAWVIHRKSPSRSDPIWSRLEECGAFGSIVPGIGQTNDLVVTMGNHRIDFDSLPTYPRIYLRRDQLGEILTALDGGEKVELEFDLEHEFKRGPIALYNVIAEIPGTEFPDEYVVIGGHIDSWDGATGTTDNGTGCATTIEAARLLMAAGAKPRRTIRFMLWSGEEQGLLGSSGWIEKNGDQLDRISCVIVHDGGTNYVSGIIATRAMQDDFERVFAPCVTLDAAMPFEIAVRDGLPGGIGSDHDAFLSAGVPGFFWRQAGRANYTYTHHTQFDTFDMAVPEYQSHTAVVIALGALGIANLDHKLSRENLRANTARNRRRLGVTLDEELRITAVVEDSVAGRAGLKIGDKLIEIGGEKVGDLDALRNAIQRAEKLKVVYERGGARGEVEVAFPRR